MCLCYAPAVSWRQFTSISIRQPRRAHSRASHGINAITKESINRLLALKLSIKAILNALVNEKANNPEINVPTTVVQLYCVFATKRRYASELRRVNGQQQIIFFSRASLATTNELTNADVKAYKSAMTKCNFKSFDEYAYMQPGIWFTNLN